MFSYETRGIRLNQSDFWLDAHRKVEFSFVSHGHSDHVVNHNAILATPATAKFHILRGKTSRTVTLEYGEQYILDDLEIELFPAGHILGSAMIRVTRAGVSLLYTGDFKMKSSLTAEAIKIPLADILIMESTFGSPEYVISDDPQYLAGDLLDFVHSTLRSGYSPVVLAYGLGKAQEAMKILGGAGLPVRVHKSAWRFVPVYQENGISFPGCAPWREGGLGIGEVLILPPHLLRRDRLSGLSRIRTVLLSGWAGSANGFRVRSDHAIPLSDHADFEELQEFVRRVNPSRVYTTHGFETFPKVLCALGYNAQRLEPTLQTGLF